MKETLQNCVLCGEDAMCVSFDGKHMVRVRRSTKCARYKGGRSPISARYVNVCRTELYETEAEAIAAWNLVRGRDAEGE